MLTLRFELVVCVLETNLTLCSRPEASHVVQLICIYF